MSNVQHPEHYQGVECIDAMIYAYGTQRFADFCVLNAFKYLWRANKKGNEREDLEKADFYLDKATELALKMDSELDLATQTLIAPLRESVAERLWNYPEVLDE